MPLQCDILHERENEKIGTPSSYSYAHIPAGSKNIAALRQVFWLAPSRRLPDLESVAKECRESSAHQGLELTAAGTAQVFHLFPF